MNTIQKRTLYNLVINNRFNLVPQEMANVLDAINALASEIQAESEVSRTAQVAKGGDPVSEARD